MNKVVFICLLSISLCYSSPAGTQEKPVPPAAAAPTNAPVTPKPETPLPSTTELAHTEAVPVTTPNTKATTPNAATTTANAAIDKPTTQENTTNNSTPDNKDKNKKDGKTEKTPSTEVTPKPEINSSTAKPDEKTTAKPAHDVTTAKAATTVKPTDAPDGKHEAAVVQAKGFDGASFVGGMILTLGLLAVGFIGFKYYKNHTDRNYHTL